MKNLPRSILALLCLLASWSSSPAAAEETPAKPIKLLTKIGNWHHPVSTTNAMAQHFFDQGLTLIYGFNHDAAIRSFKRALELDPRLALAHWGIGYALGPNINLDVDPEREKAAFEETQKALALASHSTPEENAYIFALTNRYSLNTNADLKQLQVNFKSAMAEVVKNYPDDLDAATLYAESMMNLRPWALWTSDGKPAEGTEEIVSVLESVLRRDPNHPGANHYYIHAVESSPTPERALPSAARLESLVPIAGHLVHMPAHIYFRTGDYAGAVKRNQIAAAVDRDYIQACGVKGIYPLLYYSHNLHFLAIAHTVQGRFGDAMKAADKLLANVQPAVKEIPLLEGFLPTRALILVAFERWPEILKLPAPDPSLKQATAALRFARGLAFASTGNVPEAEAEHSQLLALKKETPQDAMFSPLNRAQDILNIADLQLQASIARSKKDFSNAIALLQQAAAVEDTLHYDEPPDWYLYSREALGFTFIQSGDPARAEQVFRDDLRRNPRKGRALYGLQLSLRAQGKKTAEILVKRGFEIAWQNADSPPVASAVK